MFEARDILLSLRDFSWPVIAFAVFAPIATYLVPSRRSLRERADRLLLVGAICLTMMVIAFLLTEGEQIIDVMRLQPAWGCYVVFLTVIGLGIAGKFALDRSRTNLKVVTLASSVAPIEGSSRNIQLERYILPISAWVGGLVIALVWLSRIAAGR